MEQAPVQAVDVCMPAGEQPEPGTMPLYDIMRFPVIDWQFRWQRPQQMSEQFAQQGHRVFYVNPEIVGLGKRKRQEKKSAVRLRLKY